VTQHAESVPAESRSGIQRLRDAFTPLSFLIGVLIIAVAIVMWPAKFGGWSTVVIVSGRSMEPTYETGDLVFTWRDADLDVGKVVVFEVPEGERGEGGLVLHRIVAFDGEIVVTQGDNNSFRDPWHPTSEHVLGSARFHIPKLGQVFFLFGSVYGLAALLAFVVVVLVWPRQDDRDDPDEDDVPSDQPNDHPLEVS
jgi:signal peptidase